MKKIVVIDDHKLFLYGLKLTLENEKNTVITFDNPLKAITKIKNIQPDLILIDLNMPEMNGLEMINALAEMQIPSPVVVLSATENYLDVHDALLSGAMGFIPKSYSPAAMLNALTRVFNGDIFVPEQIIEKINKLEQTAKDKQQTFNLSERQMQILKLMHKGKKNQEIADALCISQDTVKFHQKGLYATLGVSGASSRLKAVAKSLSIGLLRG